MPRSKYKKRANGKYETKVEIGRRDDGTRIWKSIYAASSKELEEKVAELKNQFKQGLYVKDPNMLIKDYVTTWYKTYKSQKSTNTKAMYLNIIDKHINPCIGELKIKDLTKTDIQNMLTSRSDRPRTCQQILMTIKQILEEMVTDRCISALDAKNMVKRLSVPEYHAAAKRALNKREIEAIQKADFTDRERAFVYAIFYFGLRREEALALMKNDFDFINLKLNINKAVIFDINSAETKGTKSYAGERTLDIPSECVEFFKKYTLSRLYLFTKLNHEEITKSSFQKMWDSIIKKMNEAIITDTEKKIGLLPIQLTPHYFRHNYCTLLYYSGLSIGKAVELMGHADYKMIMDIYKHLDEEKEKTADKINKNIKLAL